ncbi:hypothetical protein [Pseudarthrobacter albicanus]|uniref:hypothetical protein n=1 Tax=Pseudarthrobacter albicanus TaxID=2823873 RepID=UPI001BACCA5F
MSVATVVAHKSGGCSGGENDGAATVQLREIGDIEDALLAGRSRRPPLRSARSSIASAMATVSAVVSGAAEAAPSLDRM